jgi:sulfate/thiosulfate transport system permease protein
MSARTPARRLPPSGALGLRAAALAYIGLLVLLPIIAISVRAFEDGPRGFLAELARPEALAALRLTFLCALGVTLFNAVVGSIVAYTVIRYRFPGKAILNALIDLPFAIPTVVVGFILVLLYGPRGIIGAILKSNGIVLLNNQAGIILALLFVTFPFVVRAVQPILEELDREEEQAAWTLGAGHWETLRRVILPVITPGIITGAALSFTRALGEFGSVVLIAGNIPLKTEVAAVYVYGQVESDNVRGATAVSLFLLVAAFGFLTLFTLLQARLSRHHHAA